MNIITIMVINNKLLLKIKIIKFKLMIIIKNNKIINISMKIDQHIQIIFQKEKTEQIHHQNI